MALIISERETQSHLYFLRGVFSNFQPCKIIYQGLTFPTTEHAFMWAKAEFFGDQQAKLKILQTDNPKEAQNIGREVKNYDDTKWNAVRYQIMYDINLIKYQQNPQLAKCLLSTGMKTLVEANGKPDLIWSCGLYANDPRIEDSSKWPGKNLLGKVLMEIREKLRSR
jgi:ribA/ribD-fused uncharacterized protein